MSVVVRSVRKDVAISSYHRTLSDGNGFVLLTPGQSFDIFLENALGTDDMYATMDDALLPGGDPTIFANVLGHLIDIVTLTQQAGLEVYIHEGVNGGSGTWIYSDGYLVTPGLGAFERGFRLSAPAARVRVLNATTALTISLDLSVRASTQ